jgi:uncharacterized membrane protein
MTRISSRYADSVTDRGKPDRQDDEVGERPSSELVTERLSTAEVEDDIAEAQREMEFAAVERLIFFTDAVVAIALTLLALELPVPGGTQNAESISISEMLGDARQHIDDYIAFLISFVVIAAHWRLHHRIFRYVRVATKAIIRLNIYWLLLIVLTPFTTKMLSIGHMNLLRFGTYAATQALQFAIFAVIVVLIIRGQHVPPRVGLQGLQEGLRQTVALAIGFAVSIPLYVLIHQWAFAVWALASMLSNLIRRLWHRRTSA